MQEHTDRLFRSAHIMNMPMPFSKDEIDQAQIDAITKNKLDSAYIRTMCFYGSEGMGLRADNLKVHVMVAAWTWGAYLGAENMEKGIRIRTSSYTRNHVNSTMCKAKANGNYINSILALQEALSTGYDELCCWITKAFAPKAAARTFSSSVTASCTRRKPLRRWKALPATRSWLSRQNKACRSA